MTDARYNRAVWDALSTFPFNIYKLTSYFCPTSTFTDVDFDYEMFKNEDTMIPLESLVTFDAELLQNPAARLKDYSQSLYQLILLLKKCGKPWMEKEYMVVQNLVKEILIPIGSSDVILGGKDMPNVHTDNIGIGSTHTWHGTADMHVRGCHIIVREADGDETDSDVGATFNETTEDVDTSSESDGKRLKKNIKQLVSTCVVSSFTEHNLHPTKNSLIPTILIDSKSFRVCLYDSVHDILLISEEKVLLKKNKFGTTILSRTALLFLWIILNHR